MTKQFVYPTHGEVIAKIFKKGFKEKISYGHLFNCCGVHADEISWEFNICKNYKILPFKGIYWKLRSNNNYNFKTNIYPVPDLNVPFLGVHITPNTKGDIFLGPTAIPAFGRENYRAFNSPNKSFRQDYRATVKQLPGGKGMLKQYDDLAKKSYEGIKPSDAANQLKRNTLKNQ